MPEVPGSPYEPYFTGEPTERPLPEPGVGAVPAAFGENVAKALDAFGGTVSKAGDELFSRAIALRKMQGEGETRDIVTDLSNQVEGVKNDFLAKEGYAAGPAARDAALDQTNQMRLAARAKITAPYFQQEFDNQYASMQRNIIREIGGHSATQLRVAQDHGQDAATSSKLERLANSTNPDDFDNFVNNDIPKIAADKASFKGEGPDWQSRYTGVLTSKAVIARATALARTGQYQEARAFIDAHDKQILGEDDRAKVDLVVNNSEDKFLGRDIARAQAQGFAPYMTQAEITRTSGVSTPLLEVLKRAQANHPEIEMTIGDKGGRRTLDEQAQLVAAGRSRTMESGHLDGTAMDVVGRENGRPAYQNLALQKQVDGAVREAADQLGVNLRPQIPWDQYHFQLERDYNQAGFVRPPLPSLEQQKETNATYAARVSPRNPGLEDSVTAHTDEQWRIKRLSEQASFDDAKTRFENMLTAGLIQTPADVPPDIITQAQQSGAPGATWAATIPASIRVHLANDDSWSQAREDKEFKVLGMLRGADQEQQKRAARMDLYGVDLQSETRKTLIKLQGQVRGGTAADPTRLAQVMHALDPILQNNGMDRLSPDQRVQDKYLMFQGMVYKQLEQMVANGETVPTNPQKLQELLTPLLKSQSLVREVAATQPQPRPTVGPPPVTTRAAFDALPYGATFTGADGKPYIKPWPVTVPQSQ
jgi:hypothetical protein